TLIALMVITAIWTVVLVMQVGTRIEEFAYSYVPAYGDLARANIRSLEQGIAIRRIVIDKLQSPEDGSRQTALRDRYESLGGQVELEILAARALIRGLIAKGPALGEISALSQFESRIDAINDDTRRRLEAEIKRLLAALDSGDEKALDEEMERVDDLRDDLNRKLDGIRADMLALLRRDSSMTVEKQQQVMLISVVLTVLAAILGLVFAALVSTGVTRPVRRLLEGARAVEAGNLQGTIVATSRDEIGHLTVAFNQMVEQLRLKERLRETFGKYVDPRVVAGLLEGPALAAEGERRVMTVLFCDVRGFTSTSEGMTPQGLVKVMNRYFSTMSAPIRAHQGVIDKYIGDAIMAYWGPPFAAADEQAQLASRAALEMLQLVPQLRAELPELLGVRSLPNTFDIRIGIATGEVLVGSIGSELMMSYTVMGDTVNLASRLEGANKEYGGRILVSEATIEGASDAIEAREIDRVVTVGQSLPQAVFEIMGLKGELTPAQLELRARFAEGLAAYRAQRWDEARRSFEAALVAMPGDGPSMTFIKRIEKLAAAPPGERWDGAWHLERK
ncbi:adenylate/guanylate cyclase domain-containing protein, partial [Bradyrhizobium sp.]|uniref:adenylate/guanylate cyclase domain-containing protein n=1 Tax=Bradyrhizobium sp. TaxID=376 RepID=UPI00351E4CE9